MGGGAEVGCTDVCDGEFEGVPLACAEGLEVGREGGSLALSRREYRKPPSAMPPPSKNAASTNPMPEDLCAGRGGCAM